MEVSGIWPRFWKAAPRFYRGDVLAQREHNTKALLGGLAVCLWQETEVKTDFSTYSTWWFGLNAAKAVFWPFFEVKPCSKAGEPQQLKARTT